VLIRWKIKIRKLEHGEWEMGGRVVRKGIFFDKGNILISKRYQLHSASATTHHSNDTMDAHNQKREKKTKKQKSRYSISGLTTAIHPPPRQHLKYRLSKNGASRKGTLL
jgi:hypothetical protein